MLRSSAVFELVGRARRRILWNGIFAQFTFAACVAAASAVLLLILGTQLLDWRWLALITLASLGAGVVRAARTIPSPYRAAQVVDSAAGLKDTLSTAVFFAAGGGRKVPEQIQAAQFATAERAAPGVDLARAIPFAVPRSVYALFGLALVASSLFALRYGIERRMDLRPPLARLLMPWLGLDPDLRMEARKGERTRKHQDQRVKDRGAGDSQRDGRDRPAGSPEQPLESIDVPDAASGNNSPVIQTENREQQAGDPPQPEELENISEESDSGEGERGETAASQNARKDREASEHRPTSAPAESSLMAKLRDAMANLMARLKQPPSAGGTPAASKNGQQTRTASRQQAGGERGKTSGPGQKQAGEGGQEAQDGQQGEEAGNAQSAQGRNASAGGEDASKNAASGIGRQDGNKDLRLAEQLAAMGKISEIIGKRSASVTGEITVEVRNGKQQLRTAYSSAGAAHADRGGEIHRDEVPVAYQHYVQQYFAEVRKQAKP